MIDQYLPDSHLFLGSVFTSVNWSQWMSELMTTQALPVAGRVHVCLLNLLVKLSNEPNVRQNDRALKLMQEAEKFSWHLLDALAYDQVINWHVMSCDPRVVLSLTADQNHPLDVAVNKYDFARFIIENQRSFGLTVYNEMSLFKFAESSSGLRSNSHTLPSDDAEETPDVREIVC